MFCSYVWLSFSDFFSDLTVGLSWELILTQDHIQPDKASTIALLIFTLFFRNAENFVSW